MFYGCIEKSVNGIRICVYGFSSVLYIGYTTKQAISLYREKHNLKYKKINFCNL